MNESEIRKAFDILKNGKDLTEIRIATPGKQGMASGYFTDIETLLAAIRPYDKSSIYYSLNTVNPACYERLQKNRIVERPKETTSDKDIIGRDYILVDIDPVRPSGTNATDDEVNKAREVGNKVYTFLKDNGFYPPVCAFSGNGVHLLYRCSMKNNAENTNTVKDFLAVLDMLFSTEEATIDTTVYNASRIVKLIGTSSRKGSAESIDRPQRESYFTSIPGKIKVNRNEYIQKIADMLPKQEAPSRFNNYSTQPFDLESFIQEHGIQVDKVADFANGGKKYILHECPFDGNHKAPDAMLFRMPSGACGFKCLHNSCANYTWHDFRLRYDPNAYSRQDYYEHRQKVQNNTPRQMQPTPEPIKGKGNKWLSMSEIEYVDPSQLPFVPTGINALDKKIMGLMLGDVSLVSGLSGAGKTSLIDWIALNVVNKGYKVAIWSGELQDFRFKSWISQIAAGKNNVRKKEGYEGLYFAPKAVSDKIDKWLDNRLWLYNNSYGNHWNTLFEDIKKVVDVNDCQLVICDNLMSLDISSYMGDKNEQQKKFINDLKEYAKSRNVHIILILHPRKEQGFQLLRMESISGSADLVNLADNLFLIHRRGRDFEKRAEDFFGKDKVEELMRYDVILEVAKNRSVGAKDTIVGLYYENESRRLKNDIAENIIYGWQESEPQPLNNDFASVATEFTYDDDSGDLPDFGNF